jgi:hypothetical protein
MRWMWLRLTGSTRGLTLRGKWKWLLSVMCLYINTSSWNLVLYVKMWHFVVWKVGGGGLWEPALCVFREQRYTVCYTLEMGAAGSYETLMSDYMASHQKAKHLSPLLLITLPFFIYQFCYYQFFFWFIFSSFYHLFPCFAIIQFFSTSQGIFYTVNCMMVCNGKGKGHPLTYSEGTEGGRCIAVHIITVSG